MTLVRAILVSFALTALLACEQESAEQAPEMDLSFQLTDESGNSVSDADFSGQLRLVFFGYTSCPDDCPVTLASISAALDSLDEQADDIDVLFISIDPKRDTPDRLRAYTDAFHPSITGLTGNYVALEAVAAGFQTTFGFTVQDGKGEEQPLNRVQYETIPDFADYTPMHSSQVYIIGTDDTLVDVIGYGSKPAAIEATLRRLLR